MLQPVADMSHEIFYRQLLRWLVSDTPKRVTGSTPHAADLRRCAGETARRGSRHDLSSFGRRHRGGAYSGAGRNHRDRGYAAGAVGARRLRGGLDHAQGRIVHGRDFGQARHGRLGRDTVSFRREDGVAENFHVEQNRELLEKLSSETGGRYYRPDEAGQARPRTSPIRKRESRFAKPAICGTCR